MLRRRTPLVGLALTFFALCGLSMPLAVGAQPTDLIISEYLEGSSNNKALELFNGTGASIDLAAGSYAIEVYFNGSGSAGTTINLAGTVADGDVWVVADDAADAAILAATDQQSTASFWSGDDAIVLRKGAAVIDSFGQVGTDPGTEWPAPMGGTQNNTLRRQATVCAGDTDETDAFDATPEYDGFGTDTFGGFGSHSVICGVSDPVINEFVADHTGADTNEFVEIFGDPSTDYSAYTIVEIEGDGATPGLIDDFIRVVGMTDANGIWVSAFESNVIENGAVTFLLVEGFTGSVGDDIDTDDDGTIDATFWTRIVDDVGTNDGGTVYSSTSLVAGYDGVGFQPGGASRLPDGADTDTDADWTRNDFDGEGIPALEPGTPTSGEAFNTPGAPNMAVPPSAFTGILINEADSDTAGTENDEFIELYDGGVGNTALDGLVVVLYNGNTDVSYDAFDLDGEMTDSDGFFVIGGIGIAGADITVISSGWLQNGADAIAVYEADAADFPNGTAVTTSGVLEALVYDTGDADDAGLLPLLNAAEPQVDENGGGAQASDSIYRCSDGAGGQRNTSTYEAGMPTPGAANDCMVVMPPSVLINELDSDMSGAEDTEFVELYDGGVGNTALDGLVVVLFNGSNDQSYRAIDLDGETTDGDGYLLIGGSGLAGADITVGSNFWLQNGADAVAVFAADSTDFPNGTAVTTTNLVDAAVYGTSDGDDAGLLVLLNPGEPQIDEDANGAKDTESSQRCPDGAGGARNTSSYIQSGPTPGVRNDCLGDAAGVVINEIDVDQLGGDDEEFIELYDGGIGNVALDGLVLVVFNGSDDQSYNLGGQANAIDLDGQSTDANGYLVIGNSSVANVGPIFGDGSLQNGADAVALYFADGADFPNDTPLTTTDLLDAVVYGTADPDDPGLLPLLLAGQPQVDESANGTSVDDSMQRCPDGAGGGRVTEFFRAAPPTPGAPTVCVLEIHEIQGAGDVSPFAGLSVTTDDNIVTAVGPEGFFIQTPDGRVDGDMDTSQGLYVFTGAPPAVLVGDQVDVTGTIEEFFGFTEMTGSPSVMVDPLGNPIDPSKWAGLPAKEAQHLLAEMGARRTTLAPKIRVQNLEKDALGGLPTAVIFDATTPSPNQPQSPVEFERYESMRISVPSGTICSGNQGFGSDPIAEVYANATSSRCLRETGIEFPGLPMLPVWDGNPENFELDLDKLGGPSPFLTGGSTYTAEGPLAFEFGGYEIWTTSFSINTAAPLPRATRAALPGEMRIGSFNLFRLFDDVDDPPDGSRDDTVVSTAEYQRRLDKIALYILDVLGAPDVLGTQEVESLSVLQDLAAEILSRDPGVNYTAYLEEGNDIGTIDVGFLVRDSISVSMTTQLGAAELLTFDNSILHDRPPFLLEGTYTANGLPFPFAVMVNHTRSLGGIDDPGDGPRVRQKRLEQAQSIAQKVQDFQTGPNSAVPLAVIGDLNAFEFTDGYVDVIGQIAGDAVPADNLVSDTNVTNPTLTKQALLVPMSDRYSFNFRGNAQVLDHALTTQVADVFARGFEFGRGNPDAAEEYFEDDTTPLYSSDHDGFVLYLMTDRDADGLPDDMDNCPDTANADQADGDMDGFGDVCDNCPSTPNLDQADGDVDGVGDVCDNCPSTSNLDQADGDMDGVGDVCDNCPSTSNLDQADGDVDGVGDVCDNCPTTSNLDQADGDVDGVGDVCDNCPLDANADQADSDMDGIGDVCDACDDDLGPVFTVIGEAPGVLTVQVEDCTGIFSVSLEPGAENLELVVISGMPGDTIWVIELRAIDPDAPAFGTVTADGSVLTGTFEAVLGGNVLAIPTVSEWGLLLLALLLAGAGLLTVRRLG